MFRLQKLLTRKGDHVIGPMSPLMLAQQICKETEYRLHGLCRVWFDDGNTHQVNEGTRLKPEITGNDTLVIKTKFRNGVLYHMWLDLGVDILCAYTSFFTNDEKNISITEQEQYTERKFLKKIDQSEALGIFKEIHENKIADPVISTQPD